MQYNNHNQIEVVPNPINYKDYFRSLWRDYLTKTFSVINAREIKEMHPFINVVKIILMNIYTEGDMQLVKNILLS